MCAALEGATNGTDSTPSNRDAGTASMDDAAHRASSDGSSGEEDALVVEVAAGDRYTVVAAKEVPQMSQRTLRIRGPSGGFSVRVSFLTENKGPLWGFFGESLIPS